MTIIRLAIVRKKYRLDGGAERFISNTLAALKNSDIEIHLITQQWEKTKSIPHRHVHICATNGYHRITREKKFSNEAKKYWTQHDFNLVQSHERITGCDIFRAGDGVHKIWLKHRSRVVPFYKKKLTDISPYHQYILSEESKMFRSPKLKKIICNSIMVKNDIMRCYGLEENKFALIYNCVDQTIFIPPTKKKRRELRQALKIPEQAFALIFVGSGFLRKGLRQVIEAISGTNHYLIVVGYDKHHIRYKRLAQSLGHLSRIRFIGIYHDILPYYQAADALILPSLYDPFPNVILEAMSCGLPIITSKSCGGAELIEQGREGFVCDALDVASLKMFVSEISSKNQDSTMGDAARKRVSYYTPFLLSHQLKTLYKDLLL
ncbi:glycosyltransferase [secondary endosymbiont of Heteropsylla cubana]|uniref:Glycosyltransferase n=1 Tax=secondary endosymbiont of Heteropsylla cubana TaxID=134287 RepID=J3TGF5_9ENTR|nr:glycosyltransferase family 4 protein [secondary endosymbiont of Heteropsylla cubana]AFP85507.1 glycosyltransferase [secondary endosymbiont of Heteropsylla cubana]